MYPGPSDSGAALCSLPSPGAGAGSLAQDAFDAAFAAQNPALAARIGAKDAAAYAHQAVRVLAAALATASATAAAASALALAGTGMLLPPPLTQFFLKRPDHYTRIGILTCLLRDKIQSGVYS